MDRVHKKMQADQAAAAQAQQQAAPPEQGAPAGPNPEQAPGLAPAAAAQTAGFAGQSPVAPPSGGVANLMDMLKNSHPPAAAVDAA